MAASLLFALMIPSIILAGIALSDFGREGATSMLIVALSLVLINIAVFFFAYHMLNKPEPPPANDE